MTINKGTFVMSFDTELAWGTQGAERYRSAYEGTRETISRMLDILSKNRLSATWAVVGHLFVDSCGPWQGRKHPEIERKGEWFTSDPGTDVRTDPLWYAPDVVEKIMSCPVEQEIGSHSFSHIVHEEFCDVHCFDSELKECRRVAQQKGIQLRSFVYPRNIVKHTQVLADNGFTIYRSRDNVWYYGLSRKLRKVAHGLDAYLWPFPPVGVPKRHDGVTSIPGNYLYEHRIGWARRLPVSFRVRKAVNGLKRAARTGKVFHLWSHPFNLATDPDALLDGFDAICREAARMRDVGSLQNLTMGQLAEHYA